jgi:hypothetical protein
MGAVLVLAIELLVSALLNLMFSGFQLRFATLEWRAEMDKTTILNSQIVLSLSNKAVSAIESVGSACCLGSNNRSGSGRAGVLCFVLFVGGDFRSDMAGVARCEPSPFHFHYAFNTIATPSYLTSVTLY